MISNTESGGESLARPMSRSMDAVSVMGEWDDDGEAGTGGWGPLFTAVAGDGSEGSNVNSTVLAGGTKAGGADSFCESLLAH